MDSIDIVACRDTLSYLYAFASWTPKDFCFDVEMIGNTLFLIRRRESTTEHLPDAGEHGNAFDERSNTWEADVSKSKSHNRLVRYTFGSFECLVRFESDGYLPDEMGPKLDSSLRRKKGTPTLAGDIRVQHQGRTIPQTAIFDLTTYPTATDRHEPTLSVELDLPRLWITQTFHSIVGVHREGRFDDVQIVNVSDRLKEWEAKNESILGRLHATLDHIVHLTKRSAAYRRLSIHRVGGGKLEFWRPAHYGWSALPDHLRERWTPKQKKVMYYANSAASQSG